LLALPRELHFGGAQNVYKITAENLNEILGTWINWSINCRKGGRWKKSKGVKKLLQSNHRKFGYGKGR
jgi:hypothetical protein